MTKIRLIMIHDGLTMLIGGEIAKFGSIKTTHLALSESVDKALKTLEETLSEDADGIVLPNGTTLMVSYRPPKKE